MAIPQLNTEGVDQTGTAGFTVSFAGFTWAANDIIELVIGTDGWVPVPTTANGFQLAQDPHGNTASVTTNGGTAGTAECGIFVFWKRAVGSTTTTDPPPVFPAPSSGGTCWCLEPNSYTGARTTGTPYHIITTAIVSTATATVAPPAVTPTLNNSLVMTRCASANDDQAFNSWTMAGSANPAAGAPASGWHASSGNQCAFTGGDGGYATAGGARSGTTTFGASTKQAQITLVMASLNEAFAGEEDTGRQPRPPAGMLPLGRSAADDESPPQSSAPDDTEAAPSLLSRAAAWLASWVTPEDETPSGGSASVVDEDAAPIPPQPVAPPLPPAPPPLDDEVSTAPSVVEDDVPAPVPTRLAPVPPPPPVPPDDEIPGGSLPAGVDEEASMRPGLVAVSRAPLYVPSPADEFVQQATSGIGGAGDMQRSLSQPPATGTLTTVATVPEWAPSTAYVVDPSQGGKNRVVNGGNIYQCRTGGTSASSGTGPSGTGTNIADGSTVKWYFVGPAQGTNTTAGSQILAAVMRGTQSQAATVEPTDNDGGGTYTVISNNAYANFTASFAGVWRRPTAANNKTNFAASAVWGGSGGAGDEMSICWVELQGVPVGAPHAFSHVERLASSGGAVVSGAITTTVPCIIVSFWFGNGNVQPDGSPDAATPSGGLTLIAGCTGPLSLTVNGYIQHMVAWRRQTAPATNFTETWLASPTDEGAQLVTVAFQDLSAPSGVPVDDDTTPMARVTAYMVPRPAVVSDDDLSPSADAGADDDVTRMGMLWARATTIIPAVADDEVAGQAVVEDDGVLVQGIPAVARVLAEITDTDELPTTPLEEWGAVMAMPVVAGPAPAVVAADDEVVVFVTPVDEDNALIVATPVAAALPLVIAPSDDEIASSVGASMVEEDATVTVVPTVLRPMLVVAPSVDEVASASGASVLDDEQAARLGVPPVAAVTSLLRSEDEVTTALAVDEDQASVASAAVSAPVLSRAADDDAFVASVLDDDAPLPYAAPPPVPAVLYVAADDDLPLAALLDDAGQLFALAWSAPLVAPAVVGDDEVATDVAPVSIIDEDQLLTPLVWQVPVPVWGPVVADELPKPKRAKAAPAGTSLLDGPIAKQVASALGAAKLLKPATLIKVTAGVRTPGAVSAGVNSTRQGFAAKGIEQNILSLQLAGTLVNGANAAIRLFGATIAGGQIPVPGDQIVMAGRTYTIVADGVSRDAASVSYLCQAKL